MPTQTRQLEHRNCRFEVRSVGPDGSGKFAGLASNFLNVDSYGSIIDPAAFGATLDHFMSDGFLTYEHRWDRPIGKPTKATVTDQGLAVEGEIYGDMFDGASVLAGMRRGVIKQMSIGFYVDEEKQLGPDELASYWQANGYEPTELDLARGQEGARVLTRVTLEEAAICMRGANPATRVSGVRSMLRNLFGLNSRGDMPPEDEMPKEPEAKMPEADMPADEPKDETAIDEAEIDAIVGRFAEAIKGVVTEMAKERKKGTKPEPDTTPEETMPSEGTEMEDEEEEMAARSILAAGYLLADLEIEAALKEGR
jgi:HK97 family phage prohead protease